MSSWNRGIDAACEAVRGCEPTEDTLDDEPDNGTTILRHEAIAAIRAIPAPPAPTEEELVERVACAMHDAYEEAAKRAGWETQERCRVTYDDLPESNKVTMLATARAALAVVREHDAGEVERLREGLEKIAQRGRDNTPFGGCVIAEHLLAGKRWDGGEP